MTIIYMNAATLGVLRALVYVVIFSVLHFFMDPSNLHGVVSDSVAGLITLAAGAFDHYLEDQGKGALFGAVRQG